MTVCALLCPGSGAHADPVMPAVAAGAVPLVPAPQPTSPPGESARRRLIAPIAAGAVSVVAAAIGAGFLVDVSARYPALDAQCTYGCRASEVATLEQRERAGQALLVIGAAGLVLDAVQIGLLFRRPRLPARLAFAPTLGGVSASGVF